MNLASKIKKAPRWAWWTVGGVTIGAFAIRMYQNKTTAADSTTTNPADMAYSGYSAGYTTPIVTGAVDSGGGSAYDTGGTDWQTGVQGLFDAYEQFFANVNTQNQATIDALMALIANGGSPPQSTVENPTPNGSPTPTAQPTAPTATGSTAQPTTASETCASKFPSYPQHNPGRGAPSAKSCFKDGCHKKKQAHIYKNGDFVVMGGKC